MSVIGPVQSRYHEQSLSDCSSSCLPGSWYYKRNRIVAFESLYVPTINLLYEHQLHWKSKIPINVCISAIQLTPVEPNTLKKTLFLQ